MRVSESDRATDFLVDSLSFSLLCFFLSLPLVLPFGAECDGAFLIRESVYFHLTVVSSSLKRDRGVHLTGGMTRLMVHLMPARVASGEWQKK